MAQLGGLAENGTQEFFETLITMPGFEFANEQIKNMTKDIDNKYLHEACESALNVLSFGLIFLLIQNEEKYLQKIFTWFEGVILALIATKRLTLNKWAGKKGIKGVLGRWLGKNDDNIEIAKLASDHVANLVSARDTTYSTQSMNQSILDQKSYLIDKEAHHFNVGNAMADRYNKTLLFKLFTKSFTPNDEVLIKRILGRDASAEIDVNDLNQVADFLFVKDSNNKVIGLSEAFLQLLNGLGYIHNKN